MESAPSVCAPNMTKPLSLHEAARTGDLKRVRALLKGAGSGSVNCDDDRVDTALQSACEEGHALVAELLIEHGADVNKHLDTNESPLCMACKNGHLPVVELLLDKGAKVNDGSYSMALDNACIWGHYSIAKLLIERGAHVNGTDVEGKSYLHWTCIYGYNDISQLLIDSGVDVNMTDETGDTPLNSLLGEYEFGKFPAVAKVLIAAGADVNIADNVGWTPLLNAMKHDDEVMEMIIEAGADVNLADNDGLTPLYYAVELGQGYDPSLSIAKKLIAAGADANIANFNGETPLHYAVLHNDKEAVEMLIAAGADINIGNNQGVTPFQLACARGRRKIATMIFDSEARDHEALYKEALATSPGSSSKSVNSSKPGSVVSFPGAVGAISDGLAADTANPPDQPVGVPIGMAAPSISESPNSSKPGSVDPLLPEAEPSAGIAVLAVGQVSSGTASSVNMQKDIRFEATYSSQMPSASAIVESAATLNDADNEGNNAPKNAPQGETDLKLVSDSSKPEKRFKGKMGSKRKCVRSNDDGISEPLPKQHRTLEGLASHEPATEVFPKVYHHEEDLPPIGTFSEGQNDSLRRYDAFVLYIHCGTEERRTMSEDVWSAFFVKLQARFFAIALQGETPPVIQWHGFKAGVGLLAPSDVEARERVRTIVSETKVDRESSPFRAWHVGERGPRSLLSLVLPQSMGSSDLYTEDNLIRALAMQNGLPTGEGACLSRGLVLEEGGTGRVLNLSVSKEFYEATIARNGRVYVGATWIYVLSGGEPICKEL